MRTPFVAETMSEKLLMNAELLSRLERLEMAFRRAQRGRPDGERSGLHRGGRIEFADYREYSPGDDFRHIDWNVLSRTDDLVVKQFEREEQYRVDLLLDCSASMGFPRDGSAPTKLEYGAACLAALGYIALAGRHRVEVGAFTEGRVEWFPVGADKERVFDLIDYLGRLEPAGDLTADAALESLAERSRERALAVLASDLLGGERTAGVIAGLAARGFDLSIIHVVSREEVEPTVRGRTVLRDAETGQAVPLNITDAAAAAYRAAFREFGERWNVLCRKHDVRFLSTTTETPFEDFVMTYLRHGGLVR
jgi:uncharacterized protein (DUF58 family)